MIQDIDIGYIISAHYMRIKNPGPFFNPHSVYADKQSSAYTLYADKILSAYTLCADKANLKRKWRLKLLTDERQIQGLLNKL